MNLTLSIDDDTLARARRIADARGTSVNQMVRDYLIALTGARERSDALAALDAMWASEEYASDGTPYRREDAYEGRVK